MRPSNTKTTARLISRHEVIERTSLSAATIWRLIQRNEFPTAIKISKRRVAWDERQVEQYIEARRAGHDHQG